MNTLKNVLITAIGTAIWILQSGNARAANLVIYNSKETFLADTNATATSPFPTIGTTEILRYPQYTHDNLQFTPTYPMELFPGRNWTNLLPGNDLAVNGVENLNIDLPSFTNVFGFDFAEPTYNVGDRFIDSTFEMTLFNTGAAIGTFQFAPPNNVASFVGVTSDRTFNRVEIREIVGGAEDEFYGRFYTGNSSQASVPESSSVLGLLTFGVLGAAFRLKRQPLPKAVNPSNT
jgi:hypothetical protein